MECSGAENLAAIWAALFPPSLRGNSPLSLATDHCSQPLLLLLCCGFTPKIGGSLVVSLHTLSDPWWTGYWQRSEQLLRSRLIMCWHWPMLPHLDSALELITFAFPGQVFFQVMAAPDPVLHHCSAQARACGKTLIRDLTAALSTLQHG